MTNKKIEFPCCVGIEALSFEEVKEMERVFLENGMTEYESVTEDYVNCYSYYGIDQHKDTVFYDDSTSFAPVFKEPRSVKFYSYEDIMSFDKSEDDEWIEWNGGECPLPNGTVVNLKLRSGGVLNNQKCEEWGWGAGGCYDCLVAYKVVETPSAKPQQALNDSPCDDTRVNESVSEESTEGFSNITVKHVQTVQISVKGYGVIEITMNEAKHLLDELYNILTPE